MIRSVISLARPEIRRLAPYSSARSQASAHPDWLFLDANEACEGHRDAPGLNRYPEPQPAELRRALAAHYDVPEACLLLCRGADEAIDLAVRVFCRAGRDEVVICPPTYGMYAISARIQGAALVSIPRLADEGFALDVERLVRACRAGGDVTRLVFLCSPDNPTGASLAPGFVEQLCSALAGRAIVVLDEAYTEFSDAPSAAAQVTRYPNLIVLRTLSKAWGLAGARLGVAIAHPEVLALLNKVRAPYPVSEAVVRAVRAAVTPAGADWMRARVSAVRARREALARALARLPLVERVFDSDANFLLVRNADHCEFLARCRAAGIVVRDWSDAPGLERCVRISTGTEGQNDRLVRALAREVRLP